MDPCREIETNSIKWPSTKIDHCYWYLIGRLMLCGPTSVCMISLFTEEFAKPIRALEIPKKNARFC